MPESSALAAAAAPVVFCSIRKRNQAVVPFRADKITAAILKAGRATGEFDEPEARRLTIRVLSLAQAVFTPDTVPGVEDMQDLVEEVLLASPFKKR